MSKYEPTTIEDVLRDYNNCEKKKSCKECRAEEKINETGKTYCQLLEKFKSLVMDSIAEL